MHTGSIKQGSRETGHLDVSFSTQQAITRGHTDERSTTLSRINREQSISCRHHGRGNQNRSDRETGAPAQRSRQSQEGRRHTDEQLSRINRNKALAAATMGGRMRTEAREELHLSCVRRRSMGTLSRAAACRGSRVRSVVAHGRGSR